MPDADLVPVNVQFFCNHHRQRCAQTLANLGFFRADDDTAIGIDLHKVADRTFTLRLPGERGKANNEAACDAGARNQHLPASSSILAEDGAHDSSPADSSAAR